jgi:hypothetical protein
MRNIFRPRLFRELSLGERILHSIVTVGILLSLTDYLLIERYDVGPLMGIPFALFGGMGVALFVGIAEHFFLKAYRRRSNTKADASGNSASSASGAREGRP